MGKYEEIEVSSVAYYRKKKPYVPRIPFGEWYPKLKQIEVGKVFHTIRFIDKYDYYYEMEMNGTEVDIYMTPTEETIARCRILGVGVITVYDMDDKIVQADTYPHWGLNDLRKILERFYRRKREWKGRDTKFIIIFLLPVEVSFETSWQPMFRENTEQEEVKIKVDFD